MFNVTGAASQRSHGAAVASVALHAMAVLLCCTALMRSPQIAPARMPGTSLGQVTLTYYSPGSQVASVGHAAPRKKPVPVTSPALAAPAPAVKAPKAQPAADPGSGDSEQSGLGDGDLQIALPTFSPRPAPSLATLPPGPGGDVVLDATIDEHGHIRDLRVLKSLGPAIDTAVIATVQQWVYTPATRDGKPVSSGQELHFHYERTQAG